MATEWDVSFYFFLSLRLIEEETIPFDPSMAPLIINQNYHMLINISAFTQAKSSLPYIYEHKPLETQSNIKSSPVQGKGNSKSQCMSWKSEASATKSGRDRGISQARTLHENRYAASVFSWEAEP